LNHVTKNLTGPHFDPIRLQRKGRQRFYRLAIPVAILSLACLVVLQNL